jgi:hypothetical protein
VSPHISRGLLRTWFALATAFALAASAVGGAPSLALAADQEQAGNTVWSASASGFGVASLQGNGNGIVGPGEPSDRASAAVAITIGSGWQEFSYITPGFAARGCSPADPQGPLCTPSSAANSTFAGTPPWTFTGPASLTVTDAFTSGDVFQVFDNNVFVGATSAATTGTNCGSDPAVCVTNTAISHATFTLGDGAHSITIIPTAVALPGAGGVGYFRLDSISTSPNCNLTQTVTRSGTTITLSYSITTTTVTTIAIYAVVGPTVIPLVVTGLPAQATTFSPSLSIPNVPAMGNIGFLTTISTASGGILCSDFDLIAT